MGRSRGVPNSGDDDTNHRFRESPSRCPHAFRSALATSERASECCNAWSVLLQVEAEEGCVERGCDGLPLRRVWGSWRREEGAVPLQLLQQGPVWEDPVQMLQVPGLRPLCRVLLRRRRGHSASEQPPVQGHGQCPHFALFSYQPSELQLVYKCMLN